MNLFSILSLFACTGLFCSYSSEKSEVGNPSGKSCGPVITASDSSIVVGNSPAEAVDLGLPSGIKWASCNVGATKPEEYGDFYSWGELKVKNDYSWNTYQYYNKESLKWTFIGNDIHGSKYDVARAKWGGNWRMPTIKEMSELSYCILQPVTYNGVKGLKVTGPNGKSIFLPAAGYSEGTNADSQGKIGYYWSSTLDESHSSSAYSWYIGGSTLYTYSQNRYFGLSVRPVSD